MAIIGQLDGVASTVVTPKLDTTHRCDGCGAQAYVEVILETGQTLLFCGHHWKRHGEAVKPLADSINNELKKLEKGVEK